MTQAIGAFALFFSLAAFAFGMWRFHRVRESLNDGARDRLGQWMAEMAHHSPTPEVNTVTNVVAPAPVETPPAPDTAEPSQTDANVAGPDDGPTPLAGGEAPVGETQPRDVRDDMDAFFGSATLSAPAPSAHAAAENTQDSGPHTPTP